MRTPYSLIHGEMYFTVYSKMSSPISYDNGSIISSTEIRNVMADILKMRQNGRVHEETANCQS